jgi:hypothetical protein
LDSNSYFVNSDEESVEEFDVQNSPEKERTRSVETDICRVIKALEEEYDILKR